MTEKFQWMQERYNELSEAVSQPEIIADTARWQRLLKEHAQLEPAVQAWQRYQQLLTQQTEAEEMLQRSGACTHRAVGAARADPPLCGHGAGASAAASAEGSQ